MNPARLAIVDDDPAFAQYLATWLGSRGYEVRTYPSGAELIQALGNTAPPDVVLLDVLMPGMNGLETLKALRSSHPGLQVIMLSGQGVPSTIVDAVRLGAVDYVVKPDDPDGVGEAAVEMAIRNAVEKLTLTSEVARLKAQVIDDPEGAQVCWGSGAAMRHVLTMIQRVADSDVSVLLSGESGVGKEVIARELHKRRTRRARNFVKVNCAALPGELLESELFGHERGAFTGAQATRIGKFEYANEGTIMLDEIGEMPPSLQAKILHVLQDREFTKLGSNRAVQVDVRVIAATNRDLETMIRSGSFREDLYYRLQVIEIRVPPLRDRRDEILPLVEFFLIRYAARYGRPVARPSTRLREALASYSWPGNIRELENVIKRYVILQDEPMVLNELQRARTAEPVSFSSAPAPEMPAPAPVAAAPVVPTSPAPLAFAPAAPPAPLATMDVPVTRAAETAGNGHDKPTKLPELARQAALGAEREAIQAALDRFRWNRRKAAQLLGVSYKTLLNKMKECGISAPAE